MAHPTNSSFGPYRSPLSPSLNVRRSPSQDSTTTIAPSSMGYEMATNYNRYSEGESQYPHSILGSSLTSHAFPINCVERKIHGTLKESPLNHYNTTLVGQRGSKIFTFKSANHFPLNNTTLVDKNGDELYEIRISDEDLDKVRITTIHKKNQNPGSGSLFKLLAAALDHHLLVANLAGSSLIASIHWRIKKKPYSASLNFKARWGPERSLVKRRGCCPLCW